MYAVTSSVPKGAERSQRCLDRREPAFGRERDLRDPDADRIFDCIGDRRRDAEHAALAYAFSAERAGAALLEDERLVATRQVTGERHAGGERRCVRRHGAVVAQLLKKALPEGLQCRAFDLTTAGDRVDAAPGIGADHEMHNLHLSSLAG